MTKKNIPSLNDLVVETKQTPFEFALSDDKVITFPAPTDMSWDEAEEFMSAMSGENTDFKTIFRTWLSDDDYQALADANLTLAQTVALVKLATSHYESVFGTAGEG